MDATQLIEAVSSGNLQAVEQILKKQPQVVRETGAHPYWGGRPQALHVAVEKGERDIVGLLLDHGADPNGAQASYAGWSPIILAAYKKRPDLVALLAERGARSDIFVDLLMDDQASALS